MHLIMAGIQDQSQGVNCNVFSMESPKKSQNAVLEPSNKKSQRMPALRDAQNSSIFLPD